jgi:hypothetical protein
MENLMKIFCTLLFLAAGSVFAQDEAPEPADPPAAAPAPCTSEKHRQFDFWVGEWDVTENGQPAGHNKIVLVHGNCALNENWTSARSGFSGASGRWPGGRENGIEWRPAASGRHGGHRPDYIYAER